MTALFAYADNEVAFIASDTCRAQGPIPFVAAKTFQWSEFLLIAQTGFGEGLQRLTGEMKAKQHYDADWRGQNGVRILFDRHRAYRLELERFQSKVPNAVAGKLLAVQAGTALRPAEIVTYDWVSGISNKQALPIYADGTDAKLFNQIALSEFTRSSSASSIDLGDWAVRCMETVKSDPKMDGIVEWPVDLSIIRRHHGVLIHVAMRLEVPQAGRHPAFIL